MFLEAARRFGLLRADVHPAYLAVPYLRTADKP